MPAKTNGTFGTSSPEFLSHDTPTDETRSGVTKRRRRIVIADVGVPDMLGEVGVIICSSVARVWR